MNFPKIKFKIPLNLLETKYWQQAGFCISCGEFSALKVEPGLKEKCPICGEKDYYDVDFLLKKEILIGIG